MGKRRDKLIVILSAIAITALFHKQGLGLNLFISEAILFSWLLLSKQLHLSNLYQITLALGLVITSLFTVLTYSVSSYIINFLVLFLLVGILIYPDSKSLLSTLGLSFSNVLNSQIQFLKELSGSKLKGQKLGSRIRKFRIFIIPIIIIILFVIIYRKSNPVFDKLLSDMALFFQEKWSFIFKDFDFLILITFLISLIISVFIFIRTLNKRLIEIDANSREKLIRERRKGDRKFGINALKNEYKAGIFMLIVLNLVILVLNVIDIKWVWFSFKWEGQYLKQFVHDGTYLLILSILISIAVVIYYFRRNLNFYRNNKLLKYLSFVWLAQNGILTISVAIRNFWYINYFALAYKRIGVIIFLVLTLYGLYTVFMKVQQKKSAFYLFKTNTYAILLVLIFSSLFNWDSYIAKYNFNNANKSFLHLNYLSTLSDKALPYLNIPLTELKQIDKIQKEKFPFEQKYMTPKEYYCIVEDRIMLFLIKWESKNFLSWNLPEYRAYKKLLADTKYKQEEKFDTNITSDCHTSFEKHIEP